MIKYLGLIAGIFGMVAVIYVVAAAFSWYYRNK